MTFPRATVLVAMTTIGLLSVTAAAAQTVPPTSAPLLAGQTPAKPPVATPATPKAPGSSWSYP